MAHAFVPIERDQALLLPPDLREWLPEDHLVWFVLDAVERLDLSAFHRRYRTGAQGRAAYDPEMMVALLLYAYASGIRSSRAIERRLQEDVAFRVIASNRPVDHATICRFRRINEELLSELFVQVVGLCVKADMVKTTVVAIDGTKIGANASMDKNVTEEQLRKLAVKVFEEAEAIDADEDRLYGERRGDEIPPHLVDRKARIEWLKEQLSNQEAPSKGDKRINSTDPDSKVMKAPMGYVQGFNAQLAVSEDHVIVAADLTDEVNDARQLEPMVDQAEDNLEQTGGDEMDAIVADAGYLSLDNVDLQTDAEVLIAPTKTRDLDGAIDQLSERDRLRVGPRQRPPHGDGRRREIMLAYVDNDITAREAAQVLTTKVGYVHHLAWLLRKDGELPPVKPKGSRKDRSAKDIMLMRLADPRARVTYEKRARIVEPVIGHLKELRGLRRFLHRGLGPCRCELRMTAAAQNLRRLWASAGLRTATLMSA